MFNATTTTRRMATISRLALSLAVALLLGSMLAQGADAKRIPANGVSIKDRVQAQRDLCETAGGGTLEATETAFGSTITKCKGGTDDGRTCVNTKQSTNCHQARRQPPTTGHDAAAPLGDAGADPRGGEDAAESGPHVDTPLDGVMVDDAEPIQPASQVDDSAVLTENEVATAEPALQKSELAPFLAGSTAPIADIAAPTAVPIVEPVAAPVVEPVDAAIDEQS